MSTTTCPNCQTPVTAGSAFCDNCGFDLRNAAPAAAPAPAQPAAASHPGGINCTACGYPNVAGAVFCENCGAHLGVSQPVAPSAPVQPPQPPQPAPQQPPYQPEPQPAPQQPAPEPPAPQPAPQQPVPQQPEPQPAPQQPAPQPPAPQPVPQAAPQPAPKPAPQPAPQPKPAQPQPAQPATSITGRLVLASKNLVIPIPAGRQTIVIGREDPVSGIYPDIDLDPHGGQEAGVGRQHAQLVLQGGRVFIEDLNSVNGTAVNRQKLSARQPHPLTSGDEVRLGKMVLQYFA